MTDDKHCCSDVLSTLLDYCRVLSTRNQWYSCTTACTDSGGLRNIAASLLL